MDWHSRYVLSWELWTTLDKRFCLDAARQALLISRPEIFNMDQGPQFPSEAFTGLLSIRMDKMATKSRYNYQEFKMASVQWST